MSILHIFIYTPVGQSHIWVGTCIIGLSAFTFSFDEIWFHLWFWRWQKVRFCDYTVFCDTSVSNCLCPFFCWWIHWFLPFLGYCENSGLHSVMGCIAFISFENMPNSGVSGYMAMATLFLILRNTLLFFITGVIICI